VGAQKEKYEDPVQNIGKALPVVVTRTEKTCLPVPALRAMSEVGVPK